jgi:hypothetical protein
MALIAADNKSSTRGEATRNGWRGPLWTLANSVKIATGLRSWSTARGLWFSSYSAHARWVRLCCDRLVSFWKVLPQNPLMLHYCLAATGRAVRRPVPAADRVSRRVVSSGLWSDSRRNTEMAVSAALSVRVAYEARSTGFGPANWICVTAMSCGI